jgi:beta-fructofuranosidase
MLVLVPVAPLREDTRDPHRPNYHFLPPANWMNDTMGIWWKGEYHIFYLYNPDAPTWRQAKEWGHAFGADLVHWKHLPSALGPAPGSPESLCCQTGSLTVNDGVPVAFYTCAPGTCMATSTDNLRSWRRHPENPVISGPPPELDVFGFRDPFVFRRDNTWYLLQGSGIRGSGGTILLYESKDLRSWRYVHPLLPGLGNEDEVWEVPELFPLDGKDVLIYSPTTESRFTHYLIGTFCDRQFRPASRGKLDLGGYLYAATTFRDPKGRQIMVAWIKEGRSKASVLKAGWSGILSVPRVLSFLDPA